MCVWAVECGKNFCLATTSHSGWITVLWRLCCVSTLPHTSLPNLPGGLSTSPGSNYDIQHIAGSRNCIADALSQLPLPSLDGAAAIEDNEPATLRATIATLSHGPISIKALSHQTSADPLLSQVAIFVKTTWPPKNKLDASMLPFYNIREELAVEQNCLMRSEYQFVVPTAMQRQILDVALALHTRNANLGKCTGGPAWTIRSSNLSSIAQLARTAPNRTSQLRYRLHALNSPLNCGIKLPLASAGHLPMCHETNALSLWSSTMPPATRKSSYQTTLLRAA